MQSYGINFSQVLNNKLNRMHKIPMRADTKPVQVNTVSVMKDDNGRVFYDFHKPESVELGGKKIKDVLSYSSIDYRDAATNKGMLYDIQTADSDISLYTHDGKFARMTERFRKPKTIQVGNKAVTGFITNNLYADGSKKVEAISKNLFIKQFNFAPDGSLIEPAKSGIKKLGSKILSMLKFF